MTEPGWATDPTGRFTQRWFDGRDWTDQVLGANGQPTADPLARTSSGLPAPGASTGPRAQIATATPPPPSGPAWGSSPPASSASGWGAPSRPAAVDASGARETSMVSIIVSGVGLLLVGLSLFGLKWADNDHSTFGDLRKAFDEADLGSLSAADQFIKVYATALGYLLLVAVVAGLGVVVARLHSGSRTLRVVVAAAAALGAVAHAVVVERLFRGPADPEIGAWLAVFGYLAIIVALAFDRRRVTSA